MKTAAKQKNRQVLTRFIPFAILLAMVFIILTASPSAASLFENRTGLFLNQKAGFAGVEPALNPGPHLVYETFSYDFAPGSLVAPKRVGYHATDPDVVSLIEKNGFRNGQAPGRLGANGVYVNNTPEGAIAEFTHHNPGKTPAVLKVEYSPGVEAVTNVAPTKYVKDIPLNVDSVSAPSVRAPTTTNTNVFNNSVTIIRKVQ